MIKKVRTAVFPVAGLGTRLLPVTKAIPKEMLPIVDRPLIQYAVDEARAAGIEHLVFVTRRRRSAIEDYFDVATALRSTSRNSGKATVIADRNSGLSAAGWMRFVRQQAPLGLGHAIWCARDLIGDEPFAILLADRLTTGQPGCLAQILETYYRVGGNVLSVEECTAHETSKYGIVGPGERISNDAFRIMTVVEKPPPETAPSNLFVNGRYVLQPEIFKHLSRHKPGVGGEIQLTDAIAELGAEQPLFGHRFRGRSFDCGSMAGFLAATVALALNRPELAPIVLGEITLFGTRISDQQPPGMS
jgi:UTP--glucose-1-phosphate uridylyltransferase